MSPPCGPATVGRIRLDKWLWQARFFKTRGLAARAVADGVVRVNAQRVLKPATAVSVGDGLTLVQAGRVRVVRILALGTRRGPAEEARALYEELGQPAPEARPTVEAGAPGDGSVRAGEGVERGPAPDR